MAFAKRGPRFDRAGVRVDRASEAEWLGSSTWAKEDIQRWVEIQS